MRPPYVLGFVFCGSWVLRYTKPEGSMHAGCWNGVGGHVEPGEDPIDAMKREFQEETGISPDVSIVWQECAKLTIGDDLVVLYGAQTRGRPTPTQPAASWCSMTYAVGNWADPQPAPHAIWLMMLVAEHLHYGIDATTVNIGAEQ